MQHGTIIPVRFYYLGVIFTILRQVTANFRKKDDNGLIYLELIHFFVVGEIGNAKKISWYNLAGLQQISKPGRELFKIISVTKTWFSTVMPGSLSVMLAMKLIRSTNNSTALMLAE